MSEPTPGAPIRFRAFGAMHWGGQLPRVIDGLIAAGAVEAPLESPDVDLVYANDEPRWQEAIEYRARVAPTAKLVLCVLDIPEWNLDKGYNPFDLLPRLRATDAVVTISTYVQSQLMRYFALPSSVIYMPIKDVSLTKRLAGERPFPYRALLAGRLTDPGKRTNMAINAMVMAGLDEHEVAVIGGERIGWGTNLGIVDDATLADLYASVDFTMACSLGEGLSLVPLEGWAAGSVPILCHDMPAIGGLYPRHWLCWPNAQSIAYRLRSLMDNPTWLQAEKDLARSRADEVQALFSKAAVARRLLGVYHSLTHPTP